ncbi:uncharacterized oxidoreductase YtbE-like [Maniola hyperantus]|uniref:uncharacterized oxidoreductase YtbE-like n=1 Tax=Aphantopus hyperantus TaxID=2795564 RepID=UPI00212058A7
MAGERNFGRMHFALNNGVHMPAVGLGTLGMRSYASLLDTMDNALETGYRLFDTSSFYGNEKLLKKVFNELLPKHGLVRDNLFITTKIAPGSSNIESILQAFARSLENLDMEYIDLYLLQNAATPHTDPKSPQNAKIRANTWLAMNRLYEQRKIKAIGVSNFHIRHLIQLSELQLVGPMVNQVEFHPYHYDLEMLLYCNDSNIRLQAQSSFGGLSQKDTTLIQDPIVRDIARQYGAGAAQVLLLWALQKGVAVIPKSNNPEHLRDNMELNFRISEEDMELLDGFSFKNRRFDWDSTAVA